MEYIEQEIEIDEEIKKVFDYINKPSNLLDVSQLIECEGVKNYFNGTCHAKSQWVYNMLGLRCVGEARVMEFIPNQRITVETTGDITSRIIWVFQSSPNKTRIILKIHYAIPEALLSMREKRAIQFCNEQEIRTLLANIFFLGATPLSDFDIS